MTPEEKLEAAADKATAASDIAYEWANGPEFTSVDTESGPLPTLAEFLRQKGSEIDDETGLDDLKYVASVDALKAREVTNAGVKVRVSERGNAEFISVEGGSPDEFILIEGSGINWQLNEDGLIKPEMAGAVADATSEEIRSRNLGALQALVDAGYKIEWTLTYYTNGALTVRPNTCLVCPAGMLSSNHPTDPVIRDVYQGSATVGNGTETARVRLDNLSVFQETEYSFGVIARPSRWRWNGTITARNGIGFMFEGEGYERENHLDLHIREARHPYYILDSTGSGEASDNYIAGEGFSGPYGYTGSVIENSSNHIIQTHFYGGRKTDMFTFSVIGDVFTKTAHGLRDGDPIFFDTEGSLPGGINEDQFYYVHRIDEDTFNVAGTPWKAFNGEYITTSSSGSLSYVVCAGTNLHTRTGLSTKIKSHLPVGGPDPEDVEITINNSGGYSTGTGLAVSVEPIPDDVSVDSVVKFNGGGVLFVTSAANSGDTTLVGDLVTAPVADDEVGYFKAEAAKLSLLMGNPSTVSLAGATASGGSGKLPYAAQIRAFAFSSTTEKSLSLAGMSFHGGDDECPLVVTNIGFTNGWAKSQVDITGALLNGSYSLGGFQTLQAPPYLLERFAYVNDDSGVSDLTEGATGIAPYVIWKRTSGVFFFRPLNNTNRLYAPLYLENRSPGGGSITVASGAGVAGHTTVAYGERVKIVYDLGLGSYFVSLA